MNINRNRGLVNNNNTNATVENVPVSDTGGRSAIANGALSRPRGGPRCVTSPEGQKGFSGTLASREASRPLERPPIVGKHYPTGWYAGVIARFPASITVISLLPWVILSFVYWGVQDILTSTNVNDFRVKEHQSITNDHQWEKIASDWHDVQLATDFVPNIPQRINARLPRHVGVYRIEIRVVLDRPMVPNPSDLYYPHLTDNNLFAAHRLNVIKALEKEIAALPNYNGLCLTNNVKNGLYNNGIAPQCVPLNSLTTYFYSGGVTSLGSNNSPWVFEDSGQGEHYPSSYWRTMERMMMNADYNWFVDPYFSRKNPLATALRLQIILGAPIHPGKSMAATEYLSYAYVLAKALIGVVDGVNANDDGITISAGGSVMDDAVLSDALEGEYVYLAVTAAVVALVVFVRTFQVFLTACVVAQVVFVHISSFAMFALSNNRRLPFLAYTSLFLMSGFAVHLTLAIMDSFRHSGMMATSGRRNNLTLQQRVSYTMRHACAGNSLSLAIAFVMLAACLATPFDGSRMFAALVMIQLAVTFFLTWTFNLSMMTLFHKVLSRNDRVIQRQRDIMEHMSGNIQRRQRRHPVMRDYCRALEEALAPGEERYSVDHRMNSETQKSRRRNVAHSRSTAKAVRSVGDEVQQAFSTALRPRGTVVVKPFDESAFGEFTERLEYISERIVPSSSLFHLPTASDAARAQALPDAGDQWKSTANFPPVSTAAIHAAKGSGDTDALESSATGGVTKSRAESNDSALATLSHSEAEVKSPFSKGVASGVSLAQEANDEVPVGVGIAHTPVRAQGKSLGLSPMPAYSDADDEVEDTAAGDYSPNSGAAVGASLAVRWGRYCQRWAQYGVQEGIVVGFQAAPTAGALAGAAVREGPVSVPPASGMIVGHPLFPFVAQAHCVSHDVALGIIYGDGSDWLGHGVAEGGLGRPARKGAKKAEAEHNKKARGILSKISGRWKVRADKPRRFILFGKRVGETRAEKDARILAKVPNMNRVSWLEDKVGHLYVPFINKARWVLVGVTVTVIVAFSVVASTAKYQGASAVRLARSDMLQRFETAGLYFADTDASCDTCSAYYRPLGEYNTTTSLSWKQCATRLGANPVASPDVFLNECGECMTPYGCAQQQDAYTSPCKGYWSGARCSACTGPEGSFCAPDGSLVACDGNVYYKGDTSRPPPAIDLCGICGHGKPSSCGYRAVGDPDESRVPATVVLYATGPSAYPLWFLNAVCVYLDAQNVTTLRQPCPVANSPLTLEQYIRENGAMKDVGFNHDKSFMFMRMRVWVSGISTDSSPAAIEDSFEALQIGLNNQPFSTGFKSLVISDNWVDATTSRAVGSNIKMTVFLGLSITIATLFALTLSPRLTVLSVIAVGGVVACTLGFIVAIGWEFNALFLCCFPGIFAVPLCHISHMALHYMDRLEESQLQLFARESSTKEAVRTTLSRTLMTVLAACIASAIVCIPTAFSKVFAMYVVAMSMLIANAWSVVFACALFPGLLCALGPVSATPNKLLSVLVFLLCLIPIIVLTIGSDVVSENGWMIF